ncbi:UNVERIFIED_CONTAM: hypothetical protein GTU68_024799 [Idotea baltica]|nr:hypothetical protein [Idotea baltica]
MPAVTVRDLTKNFDVTSSRLHVRAVDDLSFEIEEGAIFGLLGPNGSGKSTTIKAILGLLTPDRGECRIFGKPSTEPSSRAVVGYLPEGPFFYRFMSGLELLVYYGQLGGSSRQEASKRGLELLERVGLEDAANRRIGGYSKGMLQRVGLAQALINDPKLLILDEPTAGVDPVGAADITRLIQEFKAEGRTILLCSHLLSQVEKVCDRVIMLNRGKIILSGEVDTLLKRGDVVHTVKGLSLESVEGLRAQIESSGGYLESEPTRVTLDDLFLQQIEDGKGDA